MISVLPKAKTADTSADAFARVVDRLLQSPHYGERWGRHWLDVVRYAETTANDANAVMRYAYRYRDYVVDAFNRDTPYDQFVVEQLAGDLLPDTTDLDVKIRRVIATGPATAGAVARPPAAPARGSRDAAWRRAERRPAAAAAPGGPRRPRHSRR